RWVVRGNSQQYGINFDKTFAVGGDFVSAKIIITLSLHENRLLTTVDILSVYLHSLLEETNLVVEYLTGFTVDRFDDPVCLLKKVLYRLKQGACVWAEHFGGRLKDLGYWRCISAPSVYIRSDKDRETILATHVDDCMAACTSFTKRPNAESMCFKSDIMHYFKYKEKDVQTKANILRMTVYCDNAAGTIKISVPQKIDQLLESHSIQDSNPVSTPMCKNIWTLLDKDKSKAPEPYSSLIGELLWISTVVHINISFAVSILSQFLQKLKEVHWNAAKCILCYLKGMRELGIVYKLDGNQKLIRYCNSDYAGDCSDCKSIMGFVFVVNGGPVGWRSKKQTVVAKLTTEAEYISVSACALEAIWLQHFFKEIGQGFCNQPLTIYIDNQAVIELTKDPVYLSKTKHIDIQ
ncbi:uncharacterized protein FOMMEDRAFT_49738, partial [Fomitiporia mediterranea MF3/22]|uniref:uncharacterized protein n=1 Tax=Fomitiporia mediterranea (strain MF3/22) TaxID=694068 RepID=UPI00044095DB